MRKHSEIRKGGFTGSGDPGPPTNLMRPQVRVVGGYKAGRTAATLRELERLEREGVVVFVARPRITAGL